MMKYRADVYQRDFGGSLLPIPFRLMPESYSWQAVGGPDQARLQAVADPNQLWQLLNMLRCPVEIRNSLGEVVWWGFIYEVKLSLYNLELTVSMDSMFNQVAITYTENNVKYTTSWLSDTDSISLYGTKETIRSLAQGGSAALAAQYQTALLDTIKLPIPNVTTKDGKGTISASVECRGWYSTLGWKYYVNATDSSVATDTQISNIVSDAGQFIRGTTVLDTSGISTSQFRDGTTTALTEVETLLKTGTTADRRYLATILRDRTMIVYTEPANNDEEQMYMIDRAGKVYKLSGEPLHEGFCPVGIWMQLREILPVQVGFTTIANAELIFIETAEFDVTTTSLKLTARNNTNGWQLFRFTS